MEDVGRLPSAIGDVMAPALTQDPARVALVARDRRLTYEQLDRAADEAAAALHGLGVRRGQVVAVSLPNETEIVVTFHAATRLGAIWLGINRNLAPPEKRFIVEDADAAVLIADEDVARRLSDEGPGLPERARLVVSGGAVPEWQRRVEAAGARYLRAACTLDDPAGIAYTSGTTGRPKGVVHSHRNLLLPGAVLVEARGYGAALRRGDCAALTILNLQVTSTLLVEQAAGTQIVMDRVDAPGIAAWIRDEAVTSWFGVPTMLHDLAVSPEVRPDDLASLDDIWTGGTYVSSATREQFEAKFGKRIHATYGLTEVPTVVTIESRTRPHVHESSGQVLPHLAVDICDGDGTVLPAATLGEITVRGADTGPWRGAYTPMLGYRAEVTATAAALREGVLYTGDVGELDPDGNLIVRDRRGSIILRGGSNVYPAEIERVLLQIPGVSGAAVVGFADERLGQRVAAAIELAPETELEIEELRSHCLRELARYKVPEKLLVRDLPRTAMGKVVRAEVEKWFDERA